MEIKIMPDPEGEGTLVIASIRASEFLEKKLLTVVLEEAIKGISDKIADEVIKANKVEIMAKIDTTALANLVMAKVASELGDSFARTLKGLKEESGS